MNTPYDAIVKRDADGVNSPPDLLWGQIYHESGFNPKAQNQNKNSAGQVTSTDRGIAQINNVAHPEVSDAQAYDPTWAINWMANKMAVLYKDWGHDWEKALVSYNAGHYVAWDIGYAKSVIAASKSSPFINDPHSFNRGYENPAINTNPNLIANAPGIKCLVNDKPFEAIVVHNTTYIMWTVVEFLKLQYQYKGDGLFIIEGKSVQGVVFKGNSYIPWDHIIPGKLVPHKINGGWSFTVQVPHIHVSHIIDHAPLIRAEVNGQPLKAIVVGNATFLIWAVVDMLKIPHQYKGDGLFIIEGREVQGVIYKGDTYLSWGDILPGKLLPHKLNGGGWNFTVG